MFCNRQTNIVHAEDMEDNPNNSDRKQDNDTELNIDEYTTQSKDVSSTQSHHHLAKQYLDHEFPAYQRNSACLVLQPKFFSLLKEVCLNAIHPFPVHYWNEIMTQILKQHEHKSISGSNTDRRFGIEEGEPIGIHHLIAIFLFTDNASANYRNYISKSYMLSKQNIHCNNFYWVGRFLFEAVQFYGTKFDTKTTAIQLYQGIRELKTFDSVAPVFSAPSLATESEETAKRFAGSQGAILSLRPKYFGNIDDSKVLNATLFDRKIRILMGTKLQLISIGTESEEKLQPIVLAMQYIEKILLQTEFDVHFYNSTDLYTPKNMKEAYLLITDRIDNGLNKSLSFARHLFDIWCLQRDFVTFETFKLEMNYMDYNLKQFLFDESKQKINVANIKKLLPNLQNYHDIDGVLRNVDEEIKKDEMKQQTFEEKEKDNNSHLKHLYSAYTGHVGDITSLIANALEQIHFRFEDCPGVLREAFTMKLSKLDISSDSFYNKSDHFKKQLMSIGLSADVAIQIITDIKNTETIHNRTETQKLIELILKRLENVSNGIFCDTFTQKTAFKELYSKQLSKFREAIEKRENVTTKELYSIAMEIEIFDHNVASTLSKYLFLRKDHQTPWICRNCEFLNCKLMVGGLWRYYNQRNRCGLCGKYNGDESKSMGSNDQKIDDEEMEKIQQEQKTNINMLRWNEIVEEASASCKAVKYLSHDQLLYVLESHVFGQIDNEERKTSLINHKEQIISYFYKHSICGKSFTAMGKKEFVKIITSNECCDNKKLSGAIRVLHKLIMNCCDDTTIEHIPIAEKIANYEEFMNDCPSIQRVNLILEAFNQLTIQLPKTKNLYPFSMRSYLSALPNYSPSKFLDDINHIIGHKIGHPQKCNNKKCIHLQRATRSRDDQKDQDLNQKKEFFNTQNSGDFTFISMLDRAHAILMHSLHFAKQQENLNIIQKFKDDVDQIELNKKQIPTYSTGTFIEYHTLKPLFRNLFEELTQNKSHPITAEQFNLELEESKLFLGNIKPKQWRSCKADEKYGIKLDEKIHIENVLAIKFYCNFTTLCTEFRKLYRKFTTNDTDQDVIRRHCNAFYWLGRFLTTAIEFFGKIPKSSETFYHALNRKFKFDQFSAVYEMPTSTTMDINVTPKFCGENGIVLQLKPKWRNKINNSRRLDVSTLSNFGDEEKEKLFAGMTVLSITNIYIPSINAYKGYAEYIASFLYFERITEQTVHRKRYYQHGVITEDTKEKWMERQNKYLVPLIRSIMYKNKKEDHTNDKMEQTIPQYIRILFEHFCDNKTNYIDLSCINEEIGFMHNSLISILFESKSMDNSDVMHYQINNKNIKLIFSNLIEYKNHMGYWINVELVK